MTLVILKPIHGPKFTRQGPSKLSILSHQCITSFIRITSFILIPFLTDSYNHSIHALCTLTYFHILYIPVFQPFHSYTFVHNFLIDHYIHLPSTLIQIHPINNGTYDLSLHTVLHTTT